MVLKTEFLTKIFDNKIACNKISIEVKKGEIFGFLGPNGAGKSTFVKMLIGLTYPTSGSGIILGANIGDYKKRIKVGYLPESFKYQDWMTGFDLLSFHASLFKIPKSNHTSKIAEALEIVNLKGQEKYKVGTYSKGMQQRIGIACSLINDPDLVILDEPSSALDPIGRKEIRNLMLQIKSRGKTVFLNSHLLNEVEMICDSIAVINKGKIIQSGAKHEILGSSKTLKINAVTNNKILNELKKIDSECMVNSNTILMKIQSDNDINFIASAIIKNNGKLFEISLIKSNLEEIFVKLIEKENQNIC